MTNQELKDEANRVELKEVAQFYYREKIRLQKDLLNAERQVFTAKAELRSFAAAEPADIKDVMYNNNRGDRYHKYSEEK